MNDLLKYPRTRHLEGSGLQKGDEPDAAAFATLANVELVVEEKVDGANVGISFDPIHGELRLQCRGHFLTGGPGEAQFALLKPWARTHSDWLRERLQTRHILYGEWCYAKHTEFYDALPHYFFEFDIFDRDENIFLSTPRRHALLAGGPVVSVPVLAARRFRKLSELTSLVGRSLYKSETWRDSLTTAAIAAGVDPVRALHAETDDSDLSEGLYIKRESGGIVTERYKWVRSDFVQTILDSGTHWKSRPIVVNALADGVSLW